MDGYAHGGWIVDLSIGGSYLGNEFWNGLFCHNAGFTEGPGQLYSSLYPCEYCSKRCWHHSMQTDNEHFPLHLLKSCTPTATSWTPVQGSDFELPEGPQPVCTTTSQDVFWVSQPSYHSSIICGLGLSFSIPNSVLKMKVGNYDNLVGLSLHHYHSCQLSFSTILFVLVLLNRHIYYVHLLG